MKINLVFLGLLLCVSGCDAKTGNRQSVSKKRITTTVTAYVDFEQFKEGRPCGDVKFMCLPESQDKIWQNLTPDNSLDFFELTPQVMNRFNNMVKEWHEAYATYHEKKQPKGEKEPMLITQLDKEFFDKVEAKQFLKEMEQNLEKEFPGFWRDVKKPIRYRWVRMAMNKAKKFGYDPKLNNAMVELCARIGLHFDMNSKWDAIIEYIKKDEDGIALSTVYLDFTLFNIDEDYGGTPITDWSLREPLRHLPFPKRPIPKLND